MLMVMMKRILIIWIWLIPIIDSSGISLDSEQKLFIGGLNEERRAFARERNKSNMHELVWSSKLQTLANDMDYSELLANPQPPGRYTLTTNYKDGVVDLHKIGLAEKSDVPIINRATEHLTSLQTRIACVERDQLVMHFKVICLFNPEITANTTWTDGTPGTNCGKGYQNKNGLCSRITVEQQVKIEKSSTPVTLDPVQEKFIVDLNEGRRLLAKHSSIANMHELTWDSQLQNSINQLTVAQLADENSLNLFIFGLENLSITLFNPESISKRCIAETTINGKTQNKTKCRELYPYQTTIACASKDVSPKIQFACLLGPGRYKNYLVSGSPGTQCIKGYKNNNDGLCSARKVEVLTTTVAPPPPTDPPTTTDKPTSAPPTPSPENPAVPKNQDGRTSSGSSTSSEVKPHTTLVNFIARVNKERRKFAKKKKFANIHELKWDPKLQKAIPTLDLNDFKYPYSLINAYSINFGYDVTATVNGPFPNSAFLYPLQTNIACGLKQGLPNKFKAICLFGPITPNWILARGAPGSKCSNGYENNDGLCSAKATVTVDAPTTPQPEISLDPAQADFIAKLNQERRKLAKERRIGNMHELIWTSETQKVINGLKLDKDENLMRNPDWHFLVLSKFAEGVDQLRRGDKCYQINRNVPSLKENCEHFYPLLTDIACAPRFNKEGEKSVMCIIGKKANKARLSGVAIAGTECQPPFVNNDGLCSLNAPATTEEPKSAKPPSTETTTSSKSSKFSPDPEQVKFIENLNEERRKLAIELNCSNMHELTWSKELDPTDERNTENRTHSPNMEGYNAFLLFVNISQKLDRNAFLNPLQTEIGCGKVKHQNFACVLGPQEEPENCTTGTPGSNCLPGFGNKNSLCSRTAQTIPPSSTIPPEPQPTFPMIHRTPETQTLPKELRDYDEKDGDEYDDDFPTASPLKRSPKSFGGFLIFVVLVIMVLIVYQ